MEKDQELKRESMQERLRFQAIEKYPGLTQYIFDKVVVVIDRRGRNIKDVPELLFGTYDYNPALTMLDQPDFAHKGVDMEYVVRCIKEVVRETGDDKFWFYPYKKDAHSTNDEDQKRRESARVRLFAKYTLLEEGPDGFGYFINFKS